MKKIFLLFFILFIAVGLGFLIHQDSGFFMLSYHHWVIATSMWVGVATILLSFVVLYFFCRLVSTIFSLPKIFSNRRKVNRLKKFKQTITQGIADLVIGDYKDGEKQFLKSEQAVHSYVNYLLGAMAAHLQFDYKNRDFYLEKAFATDPETNFVVSLLQAQLYMQSDQIDEALLIFKQLYRKAPDNIIILTSLKNIYLSTHDFQSLNLIAPQLKKQKLISADELRRMTV